MNKILLLPLFTIIAIQASALGFTYEGINYTILDEAAKTVVTKAGTSTAAGSEVSGEIVIPSIVSDGINSYTVSGIGNKSFYKTTITSVSIPNSVTSIGSDAFKSCTRLASAELGEGIEKIGTSAFAKCESLKAISIPDKVTYVDEETFSECNSLESVIIGKSVSSIGYYAFMYCESLETITIPDNVSNLEEGAFLGCSGLKKIEFGKSLSTIEKEVFEECTSIAEFTVSEENQTFAALDGALFNKELSHLYICPKNKSGEYKIPASVTTIEAYAFSECKSLTSVTAPDDLTEIGEYAFSKCKKITALNLGNSLTKIGKYAFNSCSALTGISLPATVKQMGQAAFIDCTALTEIKLPETLNVVEPATFRRCSKLAAIDLPRAVTTISENAFTDCVSLATVTLSSELKEIKDRAFANCTKLEAVYYPASEPISALTTIFPTAIYSSATLFVPSGSENTYSKVNPWNQFKNISGHSFSGIDDITSDANTAATEVYNMSGVKVADTIDNLPAGTFIVSQGGNVKKIYIK